MNKKTPRGLGSFFRELKTIDCGEANYCLEVPKRNF